PWTTPRNESWDAFDAHNPFLAQVATGSTISTSTVSRLSYLPALPTATLTATWDYDGDGIPDAADNDNDGIWDGVFLDCGIPDVVDANGNSVQVRASVLIVDLDGRFNVNAHDSLARILYTGTNYNWTSGSNNCWSSTPAWTAIGTGTVPMGSGYGPAEVNGRWMLFGSSTLTGTAGAFASAENPVLLALAGGAGSLVNGLRSGGSRYSTGAVTPRIGSLEGRYGERGAANWSTVSGSMLLSGNGNLLRFGTTAFVTPVLSTFALSGSSNADDEPSRTNDRRADPTQPAAVNYGVPPVWWTGDNVFDWSSPPVMSGVTTTSGTIFNWSRPPNPQGTMPSASAWTSVTDPSPVLGAVPSPRAVFNSPPDLHGRMRTTTGSAATGGIVPQLLFDKPDWTRVFTEDTNNNTALDSGEDIDQDNRIDVFRLPVETTDDPYEILLDTRIGSGGQLHDPATDGTAAGQLRDNPFQPAELEAVLRPYDSDSVRLAPRLAAMLGSAAEEARLRVTTESWDTTAITGSAALLLFGTSGGSGGWLQNASGSLYGSDPVSGIIGGEVSRGERLDLNRGLQPATTATAEYGASNPYFVQRQALFKDLYTLLVALGSPANAATAQWAANAIEFRDADSVMTPFEYDSNPANGWNVDGNIYTDDGSERAVVFGAERPEILIQQAFAWRNTLTGTGGMAITLHRPWNATASGTMPVIGSATSPVLKTGTTPGEPCDFALDTLTNGLSGTPQNRVDLGKKPHAGIMESGTNPLFSTGTSGLIESGTTVVSGRSVVTGTTTYPIWRLKIVAGGITSYVRFDTGTAGATATNEFTVSGLTDANRLSVVPAIGADSTVTIVSGTELTSGTGVMLSGTRTPPLTTLTQSIPVIPPPGNAVSCTIAGMKVPGAATTATISLERLSDPRVFLPVSGSLAGPYVPGTYMGTSPLATFPVSSVWDSSEPLASGTIPVRYIVVDSCTISVCETGTGNAMANPTLPVAGFISCRTGSTGPFWLPSQPLATSFSLSQPLQLLASASGSTAWLPWPNRPFVSSAELLLVPRVDQLGLLHGYTRPTPFNQSTVGLPVAPDLLFDAVHVPTRFAGVHRTDLTGFGTAVGIFTTVNQISSFREPGRVNLNTITGTDVWNAVVAGPRSAPVQVFVTGSGFLPPSGTVSGTAARNMAHLLALSGSGTGYGAVVASDTAAPGTAMATGTTWNPLHTIYTATRLANTTTPRSNVFAVWVTLRESSVGNPDSVRMRRAFYIVDRSIPVGYEEGRDHNVRDCIRLRRIIE
ncbi:MAG: hypothetical protein EBZ59_09105, partial [Planctomycetia bacterium]|nr:hypothetical protein [Planctomycetia bacterium]